MEKQSSHWDFKGLWIGALAGGVAATVVVEGLRRMLVHFKRKRLLSSGFSFQEHDVDTLGSMAVLIEAVRSCEAEIRKIVGVLTPVGSASLSIKAFQALSTIDEEKTLILLAVLKGKLEEDDIPTRSFLGMIEALNHAILLWMATVATSSENPSGDAKNKMYAILHALRFLKRIFDMWLH